MRDEDGRAAPDDARRAFLKGALSLPLAAMLFMPGPAAAQEAGTVETIELQLDNGESLSGAFVLPQAEKAPAILLVHEWWGLNDQIRAVAAELGRLGFVTFAINLFDEDPATTPQDALQLVQGLEPQAATARLVAAIDWLAAHERGNERVGAIGWGFGGGWALNAALATPVDATVVYYGNVDRSAEQLKALAGPVLGHFATRDANITQAMVERFEAAMDEAGRRNLLAVHWYEAEHAFANPDDGRHSADNARLAWHRTLEFLRTRLRG